MNQKYFFQTILTIVMLYNNNAIHACCPIISNFYRYITGHPDEKPHLSDTDQHIEQQDQRPTAEKTFLKLAQAAHSVKHDDNNSFQVDTSVEHDDRSWIFVNKTS